MTAGPRAFRLIARGIQSLLETSPLCSLPEQIQKTISRDQLLYPPPLTHHTLHTLTPHTPLPFATSTPQLDSSLAVLSYPYNDIQLQHPLAALPFPDVLVGTLIPSHPHTPTPSHPHSLTPTPIGSPPFPPRSDRHALLTSRCRRSAAQVCAGVGGAPAGRAPASAATQH